MEQIKEASVSVHDVAFHFWDKQPEKNITNDNVSKTLFWLLDAANSGKLEAWYHNKKVNISDYSP
jgi:hypothetical protein